MSLWILNNALSNDVVNDLKTICPDTALSIDIGQHADGNFGGGQVTFPSGPTASDFGTTYVNGFIISPVTVAIRGEPDGFSVKAVNNFTLQDVGGATTFDKYPGTTLIEIVYTPGNLNCNGQGGWVLEGGTGKHIPAPGHVRLFHEMAHADDIISGTFGGTPADDDEASALIQENNYRASRGLPARGGTIGGCNPAPPPANNTPPPRSGGDCFIATAAFGSPIEPEVQLLRSFRDDILRKTRAGDRFFDSYWKHYYRVSPLVVAAMQSDAEIKRVVRWSVVTPIVRYLEFLLSFPDARIEELNEPWRSFLEKMQNDLEKWTSEIDIPRSFRGLDATSAAQEIAIVLKYVLRSETSRENYLSDLERRGEIPLRGAPLELQTVSQRLRQYGLGEDTTRRVLEDRSAHSSQVAGFYMNSNEMIPASSLPATGDWVYQVTVTNLSGDSFDQVVLFYSQTTDPTAVVFLAQDNVQNGAVVTFNLGPCSLVSSYVIGFLSGGTTVAQIPNSDPIFQGQPHITPALDHQIHAMDPPCLNGWTIS